jgi:hypothetical protein
LTIVAVASLSSCVATRYDASIPSTPTTEAPTTLPSGAATELLPRLLQASGSLSAAITAADHKSEVAAEIQDLWNAVQQEIAATRPELLGGFESSVALAERAARFNRAADADKAYKNLQVLVASYLGE